jgi:2'-5' RNA ligase
VVDAADGVPAHVTLLFPFVAPARLDVVVRAGLAAVAARHPGFAYTIGGPATWPDTVYATLDPVEPFVRLQADFAAAFPGFPIYGRSADFIYEPHITIVESAALPEPAVLAAPAWEALPHKGRAAAVEVIVRADPGRWRTLWRIPLAGFRPRGRR